MKTCFGVWFRLRAGAVSALCMCLATFWPGLVGADTVTLVPKGSVWKYCSTNYYPGTNWMMRSFNDTAWPSGLGQLGYGDGDEATIIGTGVPRISRPIFDVLSSGPTWSA